MAGLLWVSDREPGIRALLGEILPEADIVAPEELDARLALGQRPDALVIDGTQLLELRTGKRSIVLDLKRVLICTGLELTALPVHLVSGPNVAVLAKPFTVADLQAAVEWLRGSPVTLSAVAGLQASGPPSDRPRRGAS